MYQEHSIFIDSVKKLVASELAPNIDLWEQQGHFPNQVFETLGTAGFLGMLVPEDQGGIGGDLILAGAWCEAFGELCAVGLVTAINMHALVITPSVASNASQSVKDTWLKPALEGKAIGAYAFTEPNAGSDLANITTRATKRGDKWVINGAKTFITNGARADFVLVLTRTDTSAGYKGFTTFFVPTKTAGFSVTRTLDKLGWHSSDTAELVLNNVELGDEYVLGQVGAGWIMASNNLNWERLMLTLTSLAGARACFRDTWRYANDRRAFGKAIIKHAAISDMLEQMYVRICYAETLCHKALALLADKDECSALVSAAKRLICDDAIWIADRAIQIHGGYGYTSEFSPERWWRDLRLMPIGGGTSEIMANITAKKLGLA